MKQLKELSLPILQMWMTFTQQKKTPSTIPITPEEMPTTHRKMLEQMKRPGILSFRLSFNKN